MKIAERGAGSIFTPKHLGLLLAVIACFVPALLAAQPAAVRVFVNGQQLPRGAVEIIDQKIYVAVRPVGRALGADISASGQTVTITTLFRQVILRIDDPWATVNAQRVLLAAAPRRSGARVVLPLRALGGAFGASVVYDSGSHTATVVASANGTPPARPNQPVAAARTLAGTVTSVDTTAVPPTIGIDSQGTSYTIRVPSGAKIAFRDVHGAVTGNGVLSQVRPGDALIVTLDPNGQLISIADIFASINGTIASVVDQSMVLQSGRVISADQKVVTVTLDGRQASFAQLVPGDKVSVRADPRSGQIRDVVALSPGGFAAQGASTPNSGGGASVAITRVYDNAMPAFRAGGIVKVSADGTPGAQARFDLSDIIIENPMRETRAGHYEGQYVVPVGTNLTDAPILVRLARGGETAVAEAPDALTILTSPPSIKEVAPRAGASINTARPNIFAAFSTVGDKGMDPTTLQMTIDGRNVTQQATRTESFLSYYPPANLGPGTVRVEVKGTDIAGNPLNFWWSFTILSR